MDETLHARWLSLIDAIHEVMSANRQHPDALQTNEGLLKVSLPDASGGRISRTFDRDEVLTGDVQALAAQYYNEYRDASTNG